VGDGSLVLKKAEASAQSQKSGIPGFIFGMPKSVEGVLF
jgi:hypothetical protein